MRRSGGVSATPYPDRPEPDPCNRSTCASASAAIERLYASRLGALPSAAELKDPKTRLQEYLQGRGHPLPHYAVLRKSGEPHEQHFVVSCTVAALGLAAEGEGGSRRKAEQEAAQRVLEAALGG